MAVLRLPARQRSDANEGARPITGLKGQSGVESDHPIASRQSHDLSVVMPDVAGDHSDTRIRAGPAVRDVESAVTSYW